MSTRRLIALALACGLAILVAGGVWLIRASGTDEVEPGLAIGTFAPVGGLSVAVLGVSGMERNSLVLEVEMRAGDAAVGDPGQGWAVISTRGLVARDDSDVSNACRGRDLPAAGTLRCLIGFQPTDEQFTGNLVFVFGRGDERASWPMPYGSG